MQTLRRAAVLLLLTTSVFAAPRSEPWPRWEAHDAESTASIDHSAWTQILQRYVDTSVQPHTFDYAKVSAQHRRDLARFIERLADLPISTFNRTEQKAYWVNLYNALTVQLVIDHYPVKSIRSINISPGLFSRGPWDKKLISVEAQDLSLNDIEHRILRPLYGDARIHYAVNCASKGCPNLQAQAYSGQTIEAMLDAAATEFINHARAAYVRNGRLRVSSLYDWFKVDFGESDQRIIEHLRQYAAPALRAALRGLDRIHDDEYDWSLNEPTKP